MAFSQMKRIRSQMHAKVKADNMTDLLIIQLNSPDINNFDPRKAIHLWNTEHHPQLRTQDLTQTAHQTQKALVKAMSNVININLIID